jgi:ABC-2 type transport system permease protein
VKGLDGVLLVAGKEFRQLIRDPYTLLLVLAAPVLQLLLIGFAFDTRASHLPMAILDEDGGRLSRMLRDRFSQHSSFALGSNAGSEEQLLELLKGGKVKLAMVIPKRYSEDAFSGRRTVVKLWVDGSDASSSAQALAEAKLIGLAHQAAIGVMGLGERPAGVELQTQVLYNPSGRSAVSIVPALVAILTELTVRLLVSLSFVRERERGTADRLRSTGLGLGAIAGGKLLIGAAAGTVTAVLLSSVMVWVFAIPVRGEWWAYVAGLMAVMAPGLGLGLWLSAEAKNQAQILQLNFLIALPSVLLSGLLFPRGGMPPLVEGFSRLLPSTWSLELMRGVVVRGAPAAEMAICFAALLGMGGMFLAIGSWRIRSKGQAG